MRSTKIALILMSPKAGHVQKLWVYEERSNGWLRAGEEQEFLPGRTSSAWHAPHNVTVTFDVAALNSKSSSFDWGGIIPGTFVEVELPDENTTGIVIERKGPRYVVLPHGRSAPIEVSWTAVVPAEVDDPTDATAG
jgi:hypothetical protein